MTALLKTKGVIERLQRSRSALEADVAAGMFPPPVRYGRNSVWPAAEVDAIAAAITAGTDEAGIKRLVISIVETRQARADAARAALLGTTFKD